MRLLFTQENINLRLIEMSEIGWASYHAAKLQLLKNRYEILKLLNFLRKFACFCLKLLQIICKISVSNINAFGYEKRNFHMEKAQTQHFCKPLI